MDEWPVPRAKPGLRRPPMLASGRLFGNALGSDHSLARLWRRWDVLWYVSVADHVDRLVLSLFVALLSLCTVIFVRGYWIA